MSMYNSVTWENFTGLTWDGIVSLRTSLFIGRVRRLLGETDSSRIQDSEIYDTANIIQNDILQKLKPVEKSFTVSLLEGVNYYSFLDQGVMLIKDIITSWDYDIEVVPNDLWKDYKDATGDNPLYATIYDNKIYLAPAPSNSDESLEVMGYLTQITVMMSTVVEAQIPEMCDDALAYGVASAFNPELYPRYMSMIDNLIGFVHLKHQRPKIRRTSGDMW